MKRLSKASNVSKTNTSKKSEKSWPGRSGWRCTNGQQMWQSWLQSSESIKSQNFQQSKVWANSWFLHFRNVDAKADGCLGFISPRVSLFLWSTPPKKKNEVHQSTEGFRLCSLKSFHARIQRNNWLAGISGHVDEGDHSFGMMIFARISPRLVFHQQTTNLASWIR